MKNFMRNVDIIAIDLRIRRYFDEQSKKLDDLENLLNILRNQKNIDTTYMKEYKEIHQKLTELESQYTAGFYLSETLPIIEEYKRILNTPIIISFSGKPVKENGRKNEIITQYIVTAQEYVPFNITPPTEHSSQVTCCNCDNSGLENFELSEEDVYVCLKCFARQQNFLHASSYKDIERINTSSKYTYDRKVHFRDCINQYQGKQNCTIPPKIYNELIYEFNQHHLLQGGEGDPPEYRFQNINKEHIMMFLKELGYVKHYENVNLIHYTLTGTKPDDISHLESKLLDDFDQLTHLYGKRFQHTDRKNFINTQHVLYQLLLRHRHQCRKENFAVLKTIERKSYHDEVCKMLFEELGWGYRSYF